MVNKVKLAEYDWDAIDQWRYADNLSYSKLRGKCLEVYGKSPAKSTFSHHYSDTTAAKTLLRQKKYREGIRGRISHKMGGFRNKVNSSYLSRGGWAVRNSNNYADIRQSIRHKLKGFKQKMETRNGVEYPDYSINDVIPYLEETIKLDVVNQTAVSALTGDTINLKEEFHLDHWDNAGDNNFTNMVLLTRKENLLKGDLSMEELLEFCKKIIAKHDVSA